MFIINRRSALKFGTAFGLSGLLGSPWQTLLAAGAPDAAKAAAFRHPGLLHTADDFARMREKVAAGAEPWKSGWERLIANPHASLKWNPRPVETVYRGRSDRRENYAQLFRDIATAYACGLRWQVSGDRAYADKAVEVMNAWANTLMKISGASDRYLASGIYGYELANAGETLRDYD